MVEYKNRLDLRRERVFTIDPSTAKDLDDALHIKPMKDGNYEVGVHIADVTYFLKEGTPLDSEAKDRGTSTYLADRVIPMLPSVLCEELCSLNPGVERQAIIICVNLFSIHEPLTYFSQACIFSFMDYGQNRQDKKEMVWKDNHKVTGHVIVSV